MKRPELVVPLLLLLSCSSTGSKDVTPVAPRFCAPSSTSPCRCSDGQTGLAACLADGSGYGECACTPAEDAQSADSPSDESDASFDVADEDKVPDARTLDHQDTSDRCAKGSCQGLGAGCGYVDDGCNGMASCGECVVGVCRGDSTLPNTAGKCTCNVLESLINCATAGTTSLLVQCEDGSQLRGCMQRLSSTPFQWCCPIN